MSKNSERKEIEALCLMLGLGCWFRRSSYLSAFGTRRYPRHRDCVKDTLVQYHIPKRDHHYGTRAYLLYEQFHEIEDFQRAITWLHEQGRTNIQILH